MLIVPVLVRMPPVFIRVLAKQVLMAIMAYIVSSMANAVIGIIIPITAPAVVIMGFRCSFSLLQDLVGLL